MKRLLFISLLSCIIAFVTLIGSDLVLGEILDRTGYFLAMQPGVTEVYDANEFSTVATISAQGLRNEPVAIPKPEGVFRILALGDSFTFGWGVDLADSWPKKLETELNKAGLPKKVEVVNAGVYGASIHDERKICRAYRDRFDTDLIVLGIYDTDDLYQVAAVKERERLADRIALEFIPTLRRLGNSVLMQSWHSKSPSDTRPVSSVYYSANAKGFFVARPDMRQRVSDEAFRLLTEGKVATPIVIYAANDRRYLTSLLDEQNLALALSAYEDRLRLFLSRCQSPTPMLAVYIPGAHSVTGDVFAYRESFGYDVDGRLLSARTDEKVGNLFARFGVPFVSVLPELRKERCSDCYFKWDFHMTPKGHETIVRAILPKVTGMIIASLSKIGK